jgi:spore coat polysaccharide biosynthesis predicted glycosyltransferase SpsG
MRLWLRPQFSRETGLGHLMRAVAVAEAAGARGIEVTFVPYGATGDLAGLPGRYGFATAGGGDGWLDGVVPGDAVLFDGYGFTATDHLAAAARRARVGAVDDFGTGRFAVDVLVNPNAVEGPSYDTPPGASVLVGPRFAMVRSGFAARRRLRAGGRSRLVVVPGGSDATGLTPTLVDLLRRDRRFDRVLLLRGPAAPAVEEAPDDADWLTVVHDPADVPAVFDEADAAMAAAGTTTWELLSMGVPTALVQIAENQRHVIAVTAQGCALSLGRPDELPARLPAVLDLLADAGEQRRLSAAALAVVDGRGAARVVAALTDQRP